MGNAAYAPRWSERVAPPPSEVPDSRGKGQLPSPELSIAASPTILIELLAAAPPLHIVRLIHHRSRLRIPGYISLHFVKVAGQLRTTLRIVFRLEDETSGAEIVGRSGRPQLHHVAAPQAVTHGVTRVVLSLAWNGLGKAVRKTHRLLNHLNLYRREERNCEQDLNPICDTGARFSEPTIQTERVPTISGRTGHVLIQGGPGAVT